MEWASGYIFSFVSARDKQKIRATDGTVAGGG